MPAKIVRKTADGIRVTIESGYVYLGFERTTADPLGPSSVSLLIETVPLATRYEVPRLVELVRTHVTPRAVWDALETTAGRRA